MSVEILALLGRCIALEQTAADIYEVLAKRFAHDAELAALWAAMAADEREHARNLTAWRALLATEPPGHRPLASGFEEGVAELERLLAESRVAAEAAEEEDAFALALTMEGSELDVIYTTLLESSPLASGPKGTAHEETRAHHDALLAMTRRRCRRQKTLLKAALLLVRDR